MGTCWVEKSWQHFEYKATTKTALHFNNFKLHMKNGYCTSYQHTTSSDQRALTRRLSSRGRCGGTSQS